MPIILGIDPGSRRTGFGVIDAPGKQLTYIASGCIRINTTVSDAERLKQIYAGVTEIIETYHPTEGAIEQVFMFHNAGSALKLGQARGVAMVAMANHDLPVSAYSAKQVKQSVVGYGAADKAQVQHMVKTLLRLSDTPQEDAADALAIALCHIHSQQSLANLPTAQKTVHGRLQ